MAEKKPELYPEWKKLLEFCIKDNVPPWAFVRIARRFEGRMGETGEEYAERAERIAKGTRLRLEVRRAEIEQRKAERQKEMQNTSEQ